MNSFLEGKFELFDDPPFRISSASSTLTRSHRFLCRTIVNVVVSFCAMQKDETMVSKKKMLLLLLFLKE